MIDQAPGLFLLLQLLSNIFRINISMSIIAKKEQNERGYIHKYEEY